MTNVALVTVTHDPDGDHHQLWKKWKSRLEHLYSQMFITVSEETKPAFIEDLKVSTFGVNVIPKKGAAHARREVVRFGLTGESDLFHYCDLDRLLTWLENHPDELTSLLEGMDEKDYVILGRTERAFETHPEEWKATERIANKIFSLEIGEEIDVTAGSCMFSKKSAHYINEHSRADMTDAEWPMIVHRFAHLPIDHRLVEGLEYHEDTNGVLGNMTESEKWLSRMRMTLKVSEAAVRTGKEADEIGGG
ncbi:hypothetical protein [Pontibacillus salipaludis]|uniref:hypothetical protein n=1 Tax=Pontibacillus salipaludis TaxID=1697394 RepID=UPI0031E5F6B2